MIDKGYKLALVKMPRSQHILLNLVLLSCMMAINLLVYSEIRRNTIIGHSGGGPTERSGSYF